MRRGLLALLVALAGLAPAAVPGAAAVRREVVEVGRSVEGRPIEALVRGPRSATTAILVVGCIHGNECAGLPILRRLARTPLPAGVRIWLIDSVNPDGRAAGTRGNAHGVDLNRNFAVGWQPLGGAYESGPRAFSEPESRAVRTIVRRIRPALTIWYHQALTLVDIQGPAAAIALQRRYARRVGLPAVALGPLPGTATRWQRRAVAGSNPFVVELAGGPLAAVDARRHAAAVLAAIVAVRGAAVDPR